MSKEVEKREDSQPAEEQDLHDPGTGAQEAADRPGQEALEELEEQIMELRRQRDEHQELLQRKQAEFDNYRKRTLREREGFRTSAQAEVFRHLLPMVDACEAGLKSMPEEDDPRLKSYRDGYLLLIKEIEKVFDDFAVERVPGEGAPFDPNLHEAVLREESDEHPEGTILEEYRKGYRMGEYLLRPSQVKVSFRSEPSESGEAEGGERTKVDIQA